MNNLEDKSILEKAKKWQHTFNLLMWELHMIEVEKEKLKTNLN